MAELGRETRRGWVGLRRGIFFWGGGFEPVGWRESGERKGGCVLFGFSKIIIDYKVREDLKFFRLKHLIKFN